MNIITKLHDKFLAEASKSPILLSDLANLEKYISESYSERSLIELIQNADDASSTKFYIKSLSDNTLLIANNGDCFTENDVIALCRSGSSTKKRKSNTIGYRGIGFKSIVNYTNNVHLVSGNIQLSFSRELTKNGLDGIENVPLVRIPHEFNGNRYLNEINDIINAGYTTVFIFETNNNSLINEINYFDETCLLFLRNIEYFISDTNTYSEIQSKRDKVDGLNLVSLITKEKSNKWLLFDKEDDEETVNIAFLLNKDNIAQKVNSDNAVIHSFMPTKNRFKIPCKINGDFSTDPSRTKIVIDDESIKAIKSISKLFTRIIKDIINKQEDKYNLISIISSLYIDPLSSFKNKNINDYFMEEFKTNINKSLNKEDFIIQPEWLSESSFLEIYGNSDKYLVTDSLNEEIIGIKELLHILDFEEIELYDVLIKATENVYSEDTRVNIIVKTIKETRFTLDDKLKEAINNAFLFNYNKKIEKICNLENKEPPEIFMNKILVNLEDKMILTGLLKNSTLITRIKTKKIQMKKINL